MNFKAPVVISLPLLKAFVYEAKQQCFAATDTKTTLPDQTSVYSYRPFESPSFAGMIYGDKYNGNTVEGGQESVTIDLVLRWRNQYYGGTDARFWDFAATGDTAENFDHVLIAAGPRFPGVVAAFLKQALMHLTADFPVRGPRLFRATEVKLEGTQFRGDWTYKNDWECMPLFDTADPFASYFGQERILLNGTQVYWHTYQGGLVRDKYFPFTLQSH